MPAHPREIGAHGAVPRGARNLNIAIRRRAGAGPRDELGGLEQQQDELHGFTSGWVWL